MINGSGPMPEFERWQREIRGLADKTISQRLRRLRQVETVIGKPLEKAGADDMLRWEESMASRKWNLRKAYLYDLKAFHRWAHATGVTAADPSTVLNVHRPPAGPLAVPLENLSETVRRAAPRMRVLLLLVAFCGLHPQEIAALRWEDLRMSADGPTLGARAARASDSDRTVRVPDILMLAFEDYGLRPSGALFPGRRHAAIPPDQVARTINNYLRQDGLVGTVDQLRRYYGSSSFHMQMRAGSRRLAPQMLGHQPPPPEVDRCPTCGQSRAQRAFSDWMMGLLAGWITSVPGWSRADKLKMLGKGGAIPQEAQQALRALLADTPTVNDLGLLNPRPETATRHARRSIERHAAARR